MLALRCRHEENSVITLHNFSPDGVTVAFSLDEEPGTVLVDVFTGEECRLDDKGRIEVVLDGYGYRWYRVHGPDDRRLY